MLVQLGSSRRWRTRSRRSAPDDQGRAGQHGRGVQRAAGVMLATRVAKARGRACRTGSSRPSTCSTTSSPRASSASSSVRARRLQPQHPRDTRAGSSRARPGDPDASPTPPQVRRGRWNADYRDDTASRREQRPDKGKHVQETLDTADPERQGQTWMAAREDMPVEFSVRGQTQGCPASQRLTSLARWRRRDGARADHGVRGTRQVREFNQEARPGTAPRGHQPAGVPPDQPGPGLRCAPSATRQHRRQPRPADR